MYEIVELEFLVQVACRLNAAFDGRLQRPSACLIRSAPRSESGCVPSETSNKRPKKNVFTGTLPLFFRRSCMEMLIKQNLARQYFQIGLPGNVLSENNEYIYCNKNHHGTAVGIAVQLVYSCFYNMGRYVPTYMDIDVWQAHVRLK